MKPPFGNPSPHKKAPFRSGVPPASAAMVGFLALVWGLAARAQDVTPVTDVDPLVKASAYGDKTVWSYHDSKPVPWTRFHPRDYGSTPVDFSGIGVRPVGRVPAPGVHPRIFFSPEDLPTIRDRLKHDPAAMAAWKNILSWTNALKLTYDPKADYAQPDWANGGFGIHGRFVDLMRIGGYGKREDYYAILAAGGHPKFYEKTSAAEFFKPGATEAFRCLIDEDAKGAQTLARATVTAVKLEQERRARDDKPVAPGEPPKPSTSRSAACALGYIYDFIFNYMTPEQRRIVHDELVTLSAWQDNYGSFNNAEASRSNWATFSYWVFDLMAIEGEPGFNDLKFLALYRGWRDFYTYSFFDSGAAYEAEGKLLFGLDAAVAFDRVGWKYGLEPLTHHPLPRSYYGKFSAYAMLPTRDSFAVFDILGGMGGGFTTPQDLVIAKYLFPEDKTTDFVYRAMVGDDYRDLPHAIHYHWHQAIDSAIFATAYDAGNSPQKLNLPLTFFGGQRALMMTRSSWDTNATFLTMHVRGASGGHPYPDRGGIMLAAQGRPWITIPYKDVGSWACDTVGIDGAEQNPTTPGRVVDYVDTPQASFLVGDASYCWDWVWSNANRTSDGQPCTRADVDAGNVDTRSSWSLVDQTFNDFAYTKSKAPIYNQPLKYNASWIAFDGILNPVVRQVNTPVLKSFRTAGIVRGPRPYVLVVDDVQRDAVPARYDWNLTLMPDVVRVDPAQSPGSPTDIVFAGKASLEAGGKPKAGEPGLLVRVLEAKGRHLPYQLGIREKINLLTISTVAPSPDFKVLIYGFRFGDPLPATPWDADHTKVAVIFPDQKDIIDFVGAPSGKTDFVVTRDGAVIAGVTRPVPPLADPATDALTENLRRIPALVANLRARAYDPLKQPGFVAGWNFDHLQGGAFVALPGSDPSAQAITADPDTRLVSGPDGRTGAVVGKQGLTVPLGFADQFTGPFTVAFWIKTGPNPSGGGLINCNHHQGFSLDVVQERMRLNVFSTWGAGGGATSMLSSWTHFTIVFDGKTLVLYRNGLAISSLPSKDQKVEWAKNLTLGAGGLECTLGGILFYKTAFTPEAIEALYQWGRYAAYTSGS